MKKKNEFTWCCKECGGTNVEVKSWVNINTNEVDVTNGIYDEDTWCQDCEDHTGIMLKEDWESQNGKE